ncbi:MAG: isoprenylcysteine carboxylmethyltransferase family protein [Gemmatimonadota bacterium]|nr:isoprenylcysteine carboxylmethyltransferase family protein [Gemmatimonadota bacterium]
MDEDRSHGPGVRIPPPLLFAMPLLTGFIVQHFVSTHLVSGADPARTLRLVGWAEVVIGLFLTYWGIGIFKQMQTPVFPVYPARVLVEKGPYRFTRNPMYLGLSVLYLGTCFVANAFWPLVFLPEAIALVYLLAIKREEAYLAREFGDAYREYCERVRRWI